MSGIRIIGTGSAVPEKILTNDEMSTWLDTSDEWIFSRTGIRQRHIIREPESCSGLAVEAAEKALEKAGKNDPDFSKEKIAVCLTATMTSDFVCPSVSCLLQERLELPESITAFDISAACTGFVYAFQTAYRILEGRKGGYALIVGSECMSTLMDYQDRSCSVLFGDGAGAAVMRFDPSPDSCFFMTAGTRGNRTDLFCRKPPYDDGYLHMNGQEVYRFATRALRNVVEDLLQKSGNQLDQIDQIVCHQANARIVESVRKRLGGQKERFFMHMDRYANTSAASVALAVDDMFQKGILCSGMKIICAAFGAGLSWNGILMTI